MDFYLAKYKLKSLIDVSAEKKKINSDIVGKYI